MNKLEKTFRELFPGEALGTQEELLPHEQIVQSLINLRNELLFNGEGNSEVFLKINSCLYRGYKL